jgi:beta-glucosidase
MSDTTPASRLAKRFPSNFIVGAATASWQVEGDSLNRGSSIWDDFASVPGNISDGTKADPACDHVNRLEEDLDNLAWLGVDAYRFSVSWPRVMPGGKSKSDAGLDFYERLVDGLRARNIKPVLTLYHWDLPSELQAIGGWNNRDIHNYFADYTEIVASRLGDKVDMWATLNEPWVSAYLGYTTKIHAPGLGDAAKGFEAAYRLMTAHASALEVLRSHGLKNLGTVLNLTTAIADEPEVEHIADYVDLLQNRFWLDLLAGRPLEQQLFDNTKHITDWAFLQEDQLKKIAAPIDWLGINYYTPFRVIAASEQSKRAVGQDFSLFPGTPSGAAMNPLEPRTEMGWEIHAPSMTSTLIATAERLPGVPLYVTENGGAFDDKLVDGQVQDSGRVDYYLSHINASLDAMDQGVDLRGYFAWSLMDNIEWAEGLAKRFGIFYVDHVTQVRTPKDSAKLIRELTTLRS